MTSSTLDNRVRHFQRLGLGLWLVLLTSCADVPTVVLQNESTGSAVSTAPTVAVDQAAQREAELAPAADTASSSVANGISEPVADIGQPTPQLVRQASLVLLATNLDKTVADVQTIVGDAEGDLLSLQDYRSPEGTAHQITMTLRVPQARLEDVIDRIRPLGTVQQQTLTAADVSTQLVDLSARLKNLRQSEAALLKIMDRSGEISHVLEVARELSTVRESIERLAAQQQTLQRQVAYAQIDLTLQSPVAAVPPLRPVQETLNHTWQTATQSVKAFTVSGLKLGLWLLAYSPYLVLLAILGYGGYRLWARRALIATSVESETA
ncbi:MAG: DUF4349 domain-containing protein [Leptolyngbyaceae cyanobacterium SM2_5_2]|nr:DUF4349 domain-containing protein [Leptolyngbyaceae cyanobacterium SM2_5_2]